MFLQPVRMPIQSMTDFITSVNAAPGKSRRLSALRAYAGRETPALLLRRGAMDRMER